MCRRNESDVVTAASLQFEHHFGEAFVRRFIFLLRFPGLRDLKILAIDAAQIAVAEKDVARAARAGQNRLFAKVRRVAGNNRQASRIARRDFVCQAIIAAILRANGAGFKQSFELLNSFFQFARSKKFREFWL